MISYISIHTFLAEGDIFMIIGIRTSKNFNPHLPCGRRLVRGPEVTIGVAFQSTPSLRKATTWDGSADITAAFQSTPSLRKATVFSKRLRYYLSISIHTFLAEGDTARWRNIRKNTEFQSTPSLRKATNKNIRVSRVETFQSTPSLRKATIPNPINSVQTDISIHTFLAEGDISLLTPPLKVLYFNPHLPCGRRRTPPDTDSRPVGISIHTFLAEGDKCLRCLDRWHGNFNPHLPCGRRL